MALHLEVEQIRAELDRAAAATHAQLVAIRHDLHAHPELPNREVRTAGVIADHLRALGLDKVRTGVGGHGVVGVLRGGLPGDRVAALRADIDALPVKEASGLDFASTVVDADYPGGPFPVAHACGHDCHAATVLSAATVLAGLRDRLPGTVVFIFQPAEEGPPIDEDGGARAMLASGCLDEPRPTMAFGLHVNPLPKGIVGYHAGVQMAASCLVRIVVTGKQVHGSTPWMGVDPMPAAADIISNTGQLYREVNAFHPFTVTIGHVEDVGRFNIVGERVTLWGTIRATADADMTDLQARLRRLAEGAAAAHGCTAAVEYRQPVPAVVNTPEWLDRILPVIRRVVGEERVAEVPVSLGYDDMSEFVNAWGGAYLMFGVQDTVVVGDSLAPAPGGRGLASNHNPGFYADDDALLESLRIHVHVAVDHLLEGGGG
jgi:amidohydrolase